MRRGFGLSQFSQIPIFLNLKENFYAKEVYCRHHYARLLCEFAALGIPAKSHNRNSQKQSDTPESLVYAYVFHLVVDLDAKAGQVSSEQERILLQNFFQTEAELSDEQYQIVKTVAYNFVSAFHAVPKRQRLKFFLLYKNELKKLLNDDEFYRFDKFVKTRLAKDMTVIKLGPLTFFGTAYISLNEATHELRGVAGISYNDNLNSQSTACSVSATMTGPNVSASGSDSADCEQRTPSVTLISTTYVDNSQYCIMGNYVISGQSSSSTSCLTTPGVPRVTSVTYEQIDTTDLLIDVNPNAGSGLRIFPDRKDSTTDMVDRRKIRVRAKYGIGTAGIRIYFRNFDLDDPSANSAPIDVETIANEGDDNNGNIDGTANTKAGLLAFPQGSSGCQTFPKGISCLTDANGEATADFTVTKQPGDNFTVAASPDDTYLSNLVLATDGINLKDSSNTQIPVTKTAANTCQTFIVNACRADMITVWRRLHIEVDSMGNVSSNRVTGIFSTTQRASGNPVTITLNVNPALEPNRFENGRLVVGSSSYRVIPYDLSVTPPVDANTGNTVKIINNSGFSIGFRAGTQFSLYDDDDFNKDDGVNLDGDMMPTPGEDVVENSDIKSWAQNSDDPQLNRFAIAYIRPDYDWAIQKELNDTNATFQLNVPDVGTAITQTVNEKRNSSNLESDDFWIAYLLFSYQGSVIEDFDPSSDSATGGVGTPSLLTDDSIAGGSAVPPGSVGSLIFLETGRDFDDLLYDENSPVRKTLVPHEIGHQFGLKGDDVNQIFGMMNPYGIDGGTVFNPQFVPRHINVMRRRVSSPGK